MNLISAVFNTKEYKKTNVQISRPYKNDGITKILYTFSRDCIGLNLIPKYYSEFPTLVKKISLLSKIYPFPLRMKCNIML